VLLYKVAELEKGHSFIINVFLAARGKESGEGREYCMMGAVQECRDVRLQLQLRE
jgi:hypothetical protein